ncbi:uncharacterized protein [Dermacentor albipictus]|uniref:uncharacterized protein isoform X2 n=1 Tax=Dermacentor albipictus TaxID=60249 RepID=UPI0031FD59A7
MFSGVVGPSWTWAVPPVLVVLLFGLLLAFILIPARQSGPDIWLWLLPIVGLFALFCLLMVFILQDHRAEAEFLKNALPIDSKGTVSSPGEPQQFLKANSSSQLTNRINSEASAESERERNN